ncbi:MAG: radical SAM protein [Candidatus Riflebacteria bacterium]|nr:radical SAM protein [Candidatus Riflebacteria bacterium]
MVNPRIAFVNPPFLPRYSRGQRSPAVTRSGTLYYPLWLAYATAHAERLGCPNILIDSPAFGYDINRTLEKIREFKPDVTIVETATPSIVSDLNFALLIKSSGISKIVIASGTHVSALPHEAFQLAPELDAVFVGEYEIPLEEAIHALRENRTFENLEGVHLKNSTPRARTRYFEDLEKRPFVSEIYKKHLPVEEYFNPNSLHPMAAIITGRGCPHFCSFCVFPQTLTGRRYRKRSVSSIIAEFKWVSENLPQVRGIFLEDDTFTADRFRVIDFCENLSRIDLPLSWTANSRADVDFETLSCMKKAKLRSLCVGFETGNQEILEKIGKGISVFQMQKFAEDARNAKVYVHGCFIAGLPGETRLSLQRTLQFALNLPLDTAQFYPLMVYPGTQAYNWAKEGGFLTVSKYRDWLSEDGLHQCVVKTSDLSPSQLVRFCNYARRRFYLRKSYLISMLKRILTEKDERHRILLSAKTFFKHLWKDR